MSTKTKIKDTANEDIYLESKYSSYKPGNKDEDQVVGDAKGTARRFFALLKPYWFSAFIVCFSSIGYTICNVLSPEYMAEIIDIIQKAIEDYANYGTPINFGSIMDPESIYGQLLSIGVLYSFVGIFMFLQQYVGAGLSQKLVYNLRNDVNKKLSNLPLSYFDKNTKGEIISKIVNDIENVSGNLQSSVLTVVTGAIQVVGALYMMIQRDNIIMTIASIFLVPVSGTIAYRVSKISKRWFKKYWNSMGAMNGHVEEMYSGHSLVKIFNHEQQSIDDFKTINNNITSN